MSPIGNPQNLLVAVNSRMETPFVTFGLFLLLPTIINLGLAFVVLRLSFRMDFSARPIEPDPVQNVENKTILPVQCSLAIILTLAAANIIASFFGGKILVPLPFIALCAAVPVLLLGKNPVRLLKNIDWPTLVFFAAMFVLMESVWQTGFFQAFVGRSMVTSIPLILMTSGVISQFISNVPFVALFQPMILQSGGTSTQLMALAAGSTIAGNLTILGAASNVIIIQNAEKEGETLTFYEFAKIGVPLTILQLAVYGVWLVFLPF
jgi:Na+/H+ antiporter NhaD/arsenite permease-like protein